MIDLRRSSHNNLLNLNHFSASSFTALVTSIYLISSISLLISHCSIHNNLLHHSHLSALSLTTPAITIYSVCAISLIDLSLCSHNNLFMCAISLSDLCLLYPQQSTSVQSILCLVSHCSSQNNLLHLCHFFDCSYTALATTIYFI